MATELDVLVIGDVITDTIVRAGTERVDDADTPASITRSPGGQGANQAAWLAVAGARTALIARVGADDAAGHRDHLASLGVEAILREDAALPTGEIVVIVEATSSVRHMYTQRGAAAALEPSDIDPAHIGRSRWVHVSGYMLGGAGGAEVMAHIMEVAGRSGTPVSLDPASITEIDRLGAATFVRPGLAAIFPNAAELVALTGVVDVESAVRALGRSVPIVVASLGAAGAMAFERTTGELVHLPAATERVVDTTGAGDALAAGFLAGHVSGSSLRDALQEGLDLAADAVARVGAH